MCVVSIDFFKDWRAMIIMRPKIKSIDWYCIVIMTINAIGEKTWFREKWWVDVIVNTQNCVVGWIWNLDQGVGDNLLDLFGNSSSIIFK